MPEKLKTFKEIYNEQKFKFDSLEKETVERWIPTLEKEMQRLLTKEKGLVNQPEYDDLLRNGGVVSRVNMNGKLFDFTKFDYRGAISILRILFEVK